MARHVTLVEAADVLCESLGIPAGTLPSVVDAAAVQLGVDASLSLVGKCAQCLRVLHGDNVALCSDDGALITAVLVSADDTFAPATATATVVPLQPVDLGATPSGGNPASTSALNTELNNVARNTDDCSKARDLVAAGADLSSTNGQDWRHTPLHQAAYHGRFDMASTLVELGADLTLHSNPCGRGKHGTPLELARGGGHGRIAEMLQAALKNKAVVSAQPGKLLSEGAGLLLPEDGGGLGAKPADATPYPYRRQDGLVSTGDMEGRYACCCVLPPFGHGCTSVSALGPGTFRGAAAACPLPPRPRPAPSRPAPPRPAPPH